MSKLERQFEEAWRFHEQKLRLSFFRQRIDRNDIDDLLQDIARDLWQWCGRRDSLPTDFIDHLKGVARTQLRDFRKTKARSEEIESEPVEYYEKIGIPFTDVWGRNVPSTRWRDAEESSIAPLERSEIIDSLEPLTEQEYRVINYLSQGWRIKEISKLVDVPVPKLRSWLREVRNALLQESPTTRQIRRYLLLEPITPPSRRSFILPIQRPDAASYLQKLPGYVPEWVLWFSRLSAHTVDTNEPITFAVVRQLAQETGSLNEEQGRRFLLAASSDKGALLSQKFFQLSPDGESRSLSFAELYDLWRKHSVTQDDNNKEWMDQIATAWEPTSKWTQLTSWW